MKMIKRFNRKFKVPAYRDGFFIAILTIILITLGLTMDWCEALINFLYKHQHSPFDDLVMTFTVMSFFIFLYGLRRNKEKKTIIKQLLITKAALQKTQNNLQVLLKSSSSIIYNTEAWGECKLLYMTENAVSILGYSKEEYYEPGWWLSHIHPNDQARVVKELKNMVVNGSLTCDYRFKHKNNSWVWMRSDCQMVYDCDGKPIETRGTWWDISTEKKSEEIMQQNNERFQLAFHATRDIIYDWDLITNELWMSDEIYRSCGYNKNTSNANLEWRESKIHPDDHGDIFAEVTSALRQKRASWAGEYRFLCADGSYKDIFDRGFIIYSSDGTPTRWIGAMSDITLRKQTETELRIAKNKAEESVKFKSEFLANMSHEIRTPLNGVIGMTELALETDINQQQKRYLENIRSSSEMLLHLINDILDFSKIDAGKLDLSPVDFSLRDELPKALQTLGLKASEKKLEFVFSLDQNVPDLYFSDALRLQQVIVNLAGNAIKFTEKGEVVVDCKLRSVIKDEVMLLFSVSDTGVGIPGDKLSTIFEDFKQADNSTTRQYGGTGLGLAISKRLVEMMGGTIWVESEVGIGSSFYFTVCLRLQDVKSKPRFIPGAFLNGKKVLVVEDKKSTREHTLNVVTQFRMRGFGVSTGESALQELNEAVAQEDPYSLVLLDISLAGQMDGFDVAVEMKKNLLLENTGIIVISMSQKMSDRERFAQLGVVEFFSKPFSQSDLLDSIQNTLLLANPDFKKQINSFHQIKTQTQVSTGSLKFLLTEDNIINQEVAYHMLTKLGHKVTIVNNGLEAVAAIKKEKFDIVLMDVQMPKMNGYEATEKIREIEKKSGDRIHIVGLTANAMKGDREKCLEKGMDDYISKPIRFDDLIKGIERFMNKTNVLDNNEREKKINDKAVANLQSLLENLNSDEEIFDEFVMKAPEHLWSSFEKLEEAVGVENVDDVQFAAHALRGISLHFDMYKVTAITLEIEEVASENRLGDLPLLLASLKIELKKALDYVMEHKNWAIAAV
jgi:two-component system sensor histidine kinase/response regulator